MTDRVETVFDLDGRVLYLDLRLEALPHTGEVVHFGGKNLQGFPYNEDYVVTQVTRSYDTDTNELGFVNVTLEVRTGR